MKNYLLRIVVAFLVSSLNQCQCVKENTTPPALICGATNTVFLPQLAKDLVLFKSGSWWIYKNTSNQMHDTFRVIEYFDYTSNKIIRHGRTYTTDKCYESFAINYRSSDINFINYSLYFFDPDDNVPYSKLNSYFSEVTTINPSGGTTLEFVGDSLLNSSFTITNIDSMKINSYNFLRLINIDYGSFATPTFYKSAYYCRKEGLVKYIKSDNSVWEIESYYIQK